MKLQQAYYAEQTAVGGWVLIGYTGPGTSSAGTNPSSYTTNFNYYGSIAGTATSSGETAGSQVGWTAESRVALNDCTKGSTWSITDNLTSNEITFTATVGDKTNCEALTPSFEKIGK